MKSCNPKENFKNEYGIKYTKKKNSVSLNRRKFHRRKVAWNKRKADWNENKVGWAKNKEIKKGKGTKTLVAEFQTLMKADEGRKTWGNRDGRVKRKDKREGDHTRTGKRMICPYLQNCRVCKGILLINATFVDKWNKWTAGVFKRSLSRRQRMQTERGRVWSSKSIESYLQTRPGRHMNFKFEKSILQKRLERKLVFLT